MSFWEQRKHFRPYSKITKLQYPDQCLYNRVLNVQMKLVLLYYTHACYTCTLIGMPAIASQWEEQDSISIKDVKPQGIFNEGLGEQSLSRYIPTSKMLKKFNEHALNDLNDLA